MSQQEVLCPNCKGGNSPQAIHCQWCGVQLKEGQNSPARVYSVPAPPLQAKSSGCTPIIAGLFIFGVILLGALWATGAANRTTNTGNTSSTGSTASNDSSQPYGSAANPAKMGETVAVGDWEVVVDKVDSLKEIVWSDFALKETAKGKFVQVYLTVKNVSAKTSAVNSFDYRLRDSSGAQYTTWNEFAYIGYVSKLKMSRFNEDIPPRSSVKLLAIFDVAEDAKDLLLGIEAKKAIALGSP